MVFQEKQPITGGRGGGDHDCISNMAVQDKVVQLR